MRTLGVMKLGLFLTLSSAVAASAGPVTGTSAAPASDQSVQSGSPTSSDGSSSDESSTSPSAGDTLFDGIGLPLLRLSAPIYMQLGMRPKLRSQGAGITEEFDMGNVSTSPALNLTSGLVIPGPFGAALANPAAVPEPTALWLLVPAVAVLQRRIRARFSRS
jgi:hypothetical protein